MSITRGYWSRAAASARALASLPSRVLHVRHQRRCTDLAAAIEQYVTNHFTTGIVNASITLLHCPFKFIVQCYHHANRFSYS